MSFITKEERQVLSTTLNKIIAFINDFIDKRTRSDTAIGISTKERGNIWLDAPEEKNPAVHVGLNGMEYYASFIKRYAPYLSFIEENQEPFTLRARERYKSWDGILEYSTDTENWTEWNYKNEISSSDDGKLYLRGIGNKKVGEYNFGFSLTDNKRIRCIGNIETLLDYETVQAGEHPEMEECCYDSLFAHCTSLTQAPELPATTLVTWAYYFMFYGCTSLTKAPALPATTLSEDCYVYMFDMCTSLTGQIHCPESTKDNANKLVLYKSGTAEVVFDL